jgi:hypothetical protein
MYSLDAENAAPVSLGMDVYHGYAETHARIEPSIHEQIVAYAQSNETLALGHVLLREAYMTRMANPRSALIVAVAALETGVKEYIAARAPAAEWLAFNPSSSPVVALLSDYLTKLQAAREAWPTTVRARV